MTSAAPEPGIRRTMHRLWLGDAHQDRAKPGPRASLSLDRILETAILIADARPEAAVSFRQLAARLGCTPMGLYTYVADKRELLDLMYDRVHAELPQPRGTTWQARAGSWASELMEMHLRHPWTREVSLARAVLGPNEQKAFERLLEVLAPANLETADALTLVATLFSLARAAATTIREARVLEPLEGDPDRWQARLAARSEVAPDFADRFPRSAALFGPPADGGPRLSASRPRPRRGTDRQPLMEGAARRAYARAVGLLLAGAAASRSGG